MSDKQVNPMKDQELEELIEASKKNIDVPVSCQEYADNGVFQNGSYRVQPNKNISRKFILTSKCYKSFFSSLQCLNKNKSFLIDCEFFDGVGWSLFNPSFSRPTQFTATPNQKDGCEDPGCYEDKVTYRNG